MEMINFRPELLDIRIISIFKECTPKLLVVTDGLNYDANDDFGLTQFVDTLKASTIHGMTPIVQTAHRYNDSDADFEEFRFDTGSDGTNGVLKSRYDVLFLFGVGRDHIDLDATEVDAIATFMEAGGGVFATGDHEDLGASFGKDVPRVKNMRYWLDGDTPDIGDTTRLSTNLPGDNGIYEFVDQSDVYAQRLYLNYRTDAGGISNPHPLLQSTNFTELAYLPDHPHEGECHIPESLTTTFELDGETLDEWPVESGGGNRISPEMVALSMSHGNSFPGKDALVPRSFMAIVAYDGHLADKGRVSTDATWHHFININIDGTDSSRDGLQDPPGTDTPEMEQIREYFNNIASWLMPKNTRRCLRWPLLITEFKRFPLFEELKFRPMKVLTEVELLEIGLITRNALLNRYPNWQVNSLIEDALAEIISAKDIRTLQLEGSNTGELSSDKLALAAFGGLVVSTLENVGELKRTKQPEEFLSEVTKSAIQKGFEMQAKANLKRLNEYSSVLKRFAG